MSFYDWVSVFFKSMEFQQLYIYIIFATLGMFGHYLKKSLSKEIQGSLYKYLFIDHPLSTFNSLSAIVVSACTYIFSGSTESIQWGPLIGLALTTGFSIDSIVNKSTPPEFTNQK